MPGVYSEDRNWSDGWIPVLKRIIGPYLLCESSFEEDTQRAADLVVLHGRNIDIACRVRRPGFASRYPNQFTIRSRRDNGAKTELEKIIDGWGDWFFYGHQYAKTILPWWLIDLKSFRAALVRRGAHKIRMGEMDNNDGSTHFRWFDVTSFPYYPPLLIASQRVEDCNAALRSSQQPGS